MGSRLVAAAAFLAFASYLLGAQSLQMQAVPAQGAIVGQQYVLPFTVTGGTAPYTWHLVSGDLPPGCTFHAHSGKISGVPSAPGDYHFTIAVTDSSIPHLQVQHEYTIHVIAGLTVEWKEVPHVHGNTISGSAIVTNQTPEEFDLTVVIVAVNQIGRATTLGYQHLKLAAQQTTEVIPFGASPGPATYYVRADAVAHRPGHHSNYRASKETSQPLTITQF
jgi:Putative Ig domain